MWIEGIFFRWHNTREAVASSCPVAFCIQFASIQCRHVDLRRQCRSGRWRRFIDCSRSLGGIHLNFTCFAVHSKEGKWARAFTVLAVLPFKWCSKCKWPCVIQTTFVMKLTNVMLKCSKPGSAVSHLIAQKFSSVLMQAVYRRFAR